MVILKNGCPLDSDFDGVYDYKDLEPYSKAMLYVDEFGRSIKNISLKIAMLSLILFLLKKLKTLRIVKNLDFNLKIKANSHF